MWRIGMWTYLGIGVWVLAVSYTKVKTVLARVWNWYSLQVRCVRICLRLSVGGMLALSRSLDLCLIYETPLNFSQGIRNLEACFALNLKNVNVNLIRLSTYSTFFLLKS